MKKINLLNNAILLAATSIPLITTSCSSTSNVNIENKIYYANKGGVGSYNLSFKNKIVYKPEIDSYSLPIISLKNIKAFDEEKQEIDLPHGYDFISPSYEYDDGDTDVNLTVVPMQQITSFLKYIYGFTFDVEIKWINTNDLTKLHYVQPQWSETISDFKLNYIDRISLLNKNIFVPRGMGKTTIYFGLHTTLLSDAIVQVVPKTTDENLSIHCIDSPSALIGNGYIESHFTIENKGENDIVDADVSFTITCLDKNKSIIWYQDINGVKLTYLKDKTYQDFGCKINPSAKAIVEAGEKGLDYTFDVYLKDKYEKFEAILWTEDYMISPYTKSIKFVKYEFSHDETYDLDKIAVTINIVAAKPIGYGKVENFILKIKTTEWEQNMRLTMFCLE